MNARMKELYFKRELKKKHKRPPKRLRRQLYPERIETAYAKELDQFVKFIKSKIDSRIIPLLPGLVKFYGRERKDAIDDGEPAKYYLAFIYDKSWAKAELLHCTHKYLGELDRNGVKKVEKIVDAFVDRYSPDLPRVKFEKVSYFGPDNDIRVLRPKGGNDFGAWSGLQYQLDTEIREDDYDEYKPHVTTDKDLVDRPFTAYALISKKGIHRTWPKTVRQDDDSLGDLADELEKVRIQVTEEYTPEELKRLSQITGRSVADFNAAQMNGQLGGIAEIDLLGHEPWLAREMGAFVADNVGLITSIGDEYLTQVQKLIANSVRTGARVEDIAADIEDRYDVATSRANLIARDQVGKFNGQLTELRQKELGIDGYTWRDSNDARVRPEHQLLNGQQFSWDDPPEPGHPGQDFQCRCWAEPALAKFYEDDA